MQYTSPIQFILVLYSLRVLFSFILLLYPLLPSLQSFLSQPRYLLLDFIPFMRYARLFLCFWPEIQLLSAFLTLQNVHVELFGCRNRDVQSSTLHISATLHTFQTISQSVYNTRVTLNTSRFGPAMVVKLDGFEEDDRLVV